MSEAEYSRPMMGPLDYSGRDSQVWHGGNTNQPMRTHFTKVKTSAVSLNLEKFSFKDLLIIRRGFKFKMLVSYGSFHWVF